MLVGIPDIVISAKLSDYRFSRFCMVSGRISDFHIDFGRRPYNTPALPCRSVITNLNIFRQFCIKLRIENIRTILFLSVLDSVVCHTMTYFLHLSQYSMIVFASSRGSFVHFHFGFE